MSNTCKICGHKSFNLKYKVKQFNIIECKNCGFVQVSEIEKYEKYEYKNTYFTNSKYDNIISLNKENHRRLTLLSKYCKKGDKVIDVGCAAGDFVAYARDDFDISGCDFSENAIELARLKYPEIEDRFRVGEAETVASDHSKYQAICLWDVIEHLYEPRKVIKGLLDNLADDGYLIMSTPNISAAFARVCKKNWPFMTPPEHVGFFSKRSMRFLASSCDCKIIEWSSRGKWVNFGFILYKINRIKPGLIPIKMIDVFKKGLLSKINLYIPTKDIQYVVIKKKVS